MARKEASRLAAVLVGSLLAFAVAVPAYQGVVTRFGIITPLESGMVATAPLLVFRGRTLRNTVTLTQPGQVKVGVQRFSFIGFRFVEWVD